MALLSVAAALERVTRGLTPLETERVTLDRGRGRVLAEDLAARLTQPPFDMPVAESELVAGYMTEYTGLRFLLFQISEFASAFGFAALAATLFLGGWYIPGVHGDLANWLGPIALGAKIMFLGFLIFWIRFTYPRFREDQLQRIAWKVLIPLSLVNIVATAILKVVL